MTLPSGVLQLDAGAEEATPATEQSQQQPAVHWRAVLDVFEAFLGTEDAQVFANAALDFVSCLIHHVRGSDERRQVEELITAEEMDACMRAEGGGTSPGGVAIGASSSSAGARGFISSDTALTSAALGMLEQCNGILAKMYRMTSCPTFQVCHRPIIHQFAAGTIFLTF